MKIILIILLLCISTIANAQDIPLQWNKNETADYYIVYWGDAPGQYIGNSEHIKDLKYIALNLPETQQYLAVKAFNNCGESSEFSKEVTSCDIKKAVEVTQGVCITRDINININIER